jgi:hypothetical protein
MVLSIVFFEAEQMISMRAEKHKQISLFVEQQQAIRTIIPENFRFQSLLIALIRLSDTDSDAKSIAEKYGLHLRPR